MAKMNDYPSVDNTEEFTQEQKAAFLGSAMCIATGSKTVGGNKVTANIPLSDITPAVPTKLSDLTDDITVDTYDSTSEAPISGKGVAAALGNFGGFQVVSLTSGANPVPDVASPSNKLIYLTKETSAKTDPYTEWIYTGNPTSALDVSKWEVIGETTVDLSNYYTKGQTDTAIETAVDSIAPVQNSVLYGGGSGGFNKRMDLLYDNTLTKVSGANGYELKVAVPVPSPGTNAHRGEVLTVNNSDEAVWAAPQGGLPTYDSTYAGRVLTVNQAGNGVEWTTPQGGGDSLPVRTNNDIGKILGIEAVYDSHYQITGNKLVWTPGLPTDTSDLGSGSTDYGAELDIAATFDNDGNPVFAFRETVPSYAYKFWEGTDADAYEVSWGNKNTTTWTRTVNNNQYTILETINEYYFNGPDITAPSRLNITVNRVQMTPPNCLIEFANYSQNDIDVYVSNQTHGSESSDCNVTYPMIPVGETYSDVHKAPAMSFISIQILGHGYTIKYRPLQQSEIVDALDEGSNYTLCADASWNNPTIFC